MRERGAAATSGAKESPEAAEEQCAGELDRCSEIDERCETAADCCIPTAARIGGFCQFVVE